MRLCTLKNRSANVEKKINLARTSHKYSPSLYGCVMHLSGTSPLLAFYLLTLACFHIVHVIPASAFLLNNHKNSLNIASTKWRFDYQISPSNERSSTSGAIIPFRTTKTPSTDLTTLSKRGIPWKDIISGFTILYNNLDLTFILLSPSEIRSLLGFYVDISTTIIKGIATSPVKYLSFTLGALRLTLECAKEIIPWDLVGELVRYMGTLVKAGLAWLGKFAMGTAGATVVWVIVSVLRDLADGEII